MNAKQRARGGGRRQSPQQKQDPVRLPIPEIKLPNPEEALSLIGKLEELRNSRVITLVTSPDVTVRGDVIDQMYEQLRTIGQVPMLDLFLHSVGGQTEIPWRLITLIRDSCEKFGVLVPGIAHSAATHLAMGADEIVMGPRSELSPVDPARTHPLLPAREDGTPMAVSVQDLRKCVEFVKNEVGNNPESGPEAMAQIFVALFDKVHPLAIGAIQQSYSLARLISTKALSTHIQDEQLIDSIVNAFSDEFFSHHYCIGRTEAAEVGLPVTFASTELWETMWALYKHYQTYFSLARDVSDETGKKRARPIVWIDSANQRRILEEVSFENGPTIAVWQEFPWKQTKSPPPTEEGEQ